MKNVVDHSANDSSNSKRKIDVFLLLNILFDAILCTPVISNTIRKARSYDKECEIEIFILDEEGN